MKDAFILHHYEVSPYSEKIRLMLGLANAHWCSLLSPVWPPRPNVDPLSGGYRRIPIAQIGADIFCDTAIIAEEIANRTNCSALHPAAIEGDALNLMRLAEEKVFIAAITAVPPLTLLAGMLQKFGPLGAYRFIKDRSKLLSGGTQQRPASGEAKQLIASLLESLDAQLAKGEWLTGEAPSLADFAVYHPLWLHVSASGKPLQASAKIQAWYKAVTAIGHGQRKEITQADAFTAARESEPRALPESVADLPLELGQSVQVAPTDYGLVPVRGTLVAVTQNRIILSRETEDFGNVHVHFPRRAYALN